MPAWSSEETSEKLFQISGIVCTAGGNLKWSVKYIVFLEKKFRQIFINLLCNPPVYCYLLKRSRNLVHGKKGKQNFLNVCSRWKYLWCIHTLNYYSAIKKNSLLKAATTWMNLKCTILSDRSQTQRLQVILNGYELFYFITFRTRQTRNKIRSVLSEDWLQRSTEQCVTACACVCTHMFWDSSWLCVCIQLSGSEWVKQIFDLK